MIRQINSNLNGVTPNSPSKNQPQFKGGADFILAGIQMCEQQPMVNVAVLDLATAIVPRTYVEGKTNPYAGAEAFRRESSGLIVNCMIPSLIVLGIAKTLQKTTMGGDTQMAGCWANGETIKLVTDQWNSLKDAKPVMENGKVLYSGEKAKVYRTIESIITSISGVDGDKVVKFSDLSKEDLHKHIKTLTEKTFIQDLSKADKKEIKAVYKAIAEATHATENIKIGKADKYFSQNLESLIGNTPKLLKEIVGGKVGDASAFAEKATKLLNRKSLLGLFGVIIPLALSMQPINRWLTAKSSGKKGAPIYKDFSETQSKELSSKEKSALLKQKFISIGSMIGVAILSMGGKIPGMNVLQFKSLFPTMDQARIISTATFASRMAASEDKNDLREATVRDIATFSSFYFLGDYVAKGIASMIEKIKPDVKLINDIAPIDKNASSMTRVKHWLSGTALKSSEEVVGKTAKNMRSACQLGNLAFSLVSLGIVIPKIYRSQTNKRREQELKEMGVDQKTIDKYYHHLAKNNPNFASNRATYKSFR